MLSKIFNNQLKRERFFLVLLITILVVVWFRKGLIIGSGESGLPFYNTSKLLELVTTSWTDVPLGTNSAIGSGSYPFYFTLVLLQNLGIPSFILQAVLYWLVLIIGTLSIHKLASLISNNTSLTRLSSALFYIFNPIVHISVLHRVQYPMMFFYSFMPLAFIIYYTGLKHKKIIYLVILGLLSAVFSFAFIGISFIQIMFGVLGSFTLWYFLSEFKQKKEWFPLLYLLLFMIIFVLINIWWIAPLFSTVSRDLGSRGSLKYFDASGNVDTFKGISAQVESILNVFRLFKPNDYPIEGSSWTWIYGTIPFVILSFFSIIAFIAGLFKKGKERLFKFLTLTSLITMFLMKGSLAPFGEITLFFFQLLPILHSFRNPFEKIGILLPFAMAIPVGFGIAIIINYLVKYLNLPKNVLVVIILTLIYPIFMFPIVNGYVFSGGPPPANNPEIGQYVRVPEYYRKAREWLDKQSELFRVLVLPMNGEGITYQWDYGYSGVELSNNLFNHSMISFSSSQAFLPEMIKNINDTFSRYPDRLWVLAQLLNIKYIMVRDDIDYKGREMESPARVLDTVVNQIGQNFSPVAEFDRLKFFQLKPEEFLPRIYASVAPIYLFDPLGDSIKLLPFSPAGRQIFITMSKSPTEDKYIKNAKATVINGQRIENIKIDDKNPIENLPFVSIYRGSPFYALVRLKEDIETQFVSQGLQLNFKSRLLGKRIVEINHSPGDSAALEEYHQGVRSIASEIRNSVDVDRLVIEALISQRDALETLKNKVENPEKIDQIISDLNNLFIDVGAKSVYPTDKSLIHRFYVPRDSRYEILISKENWETYFPNAVINELDLDGKIITLSPIKPQNSAATISLGVYTLSKGVHEISIAQPAAKNLIAEKLPEVLILSSSNKQPITKAIPIEELKNTYIYILSFDYFVDKGNVPVVVINSDADLTNKKGEKIPRLGIALAQDNYDFGWKKYTGLFTPFPFAQKNSVSFKVLPFGDCKAIVERPYRRYCEDNEFAQRVMQDSSYRIRNLKVEQAFYNPVVLREVESASIPTTVPSIDFEQINSARYKVKVTDAKEPFFLVLSTAFDPQWSAYFLTSRSKSLLELLSDSLSGEPVSATNHLLVNGYSNAWYIERPGSYEMLLEYSPERIFVIGQKFSILTIVSALIFLIVHKVYVKHNSR